MHRERPEAEPDVVIDDLIWNTVFTRDEVTKGANQARIRELAFEKGIFPASIQGLYRAGGKNLYHGITVPAINIRGITYEVARAVFRAALRHGVGAFIFEIARSEIGYTDQRPGEYTACVLAAAVKEGFRGPVFLQGDHFQVDRDRFAADPGEELAAIRDLIREAVDAGFLNIDIDASTIVDLDRPTLEEQQEENCRVTAEMTRYIREIEPNEVVISVGGEIGEVGKRNSTVDDLNAFMGGYMEYLGDIEGISKISVQTGTHHGGVVLPDGSIAKVQLDFKTLEDLSKTARERYGMAGAVQHGASTLPEEAFKLFPQAGTAEVHLATGFQNLIFDSPHFPSDLKGAIREHLSDRYANQRNPNETDEQFFYKTRKRSFGDFKRELWSLPEDVLNRIGETLQDRFSLLFQRLNVVETAELIQKYVSRPGT
jgi:fructose/tagatose bisphosphate aldolase